MQAHSVESQIRPYNQGMAAGRPPKSDERSPLGQRLFEARQNAGLSQAKIAELIGVPQQTYAGWERRNCAINPEHLARLAEVLGVSVDALLGRKSTTRRGGPKGKAQRLFEEVSSLPRSRQQRILNVVEDLLAAHRLNPKKAS